MPVSIYLCMQEWATGILQLDVRSRSLSFKHTTLACRTMAPPGAEFQTRSWPFLYPAGRCVAPRTSRALDRREAFKHPARTRMLTLELMGKPCIWTSEDIMKTILANFKSRVLRALPSKLSSPGTKLQHFEEMPILPSHRYRSIPATLLAHDQ